MDSKREIKVGDCVMYADSGEVVCNEDGEPLKVMKIEEYDYVGVICVFYSDGGYDYLSAVEVAPSLLLELL